MPHCCAEEERLLVAVSAAYTAHRAAGEAYRVAGDAYRAATIACNDAHDALQAHRRTHGGENKT